MRLIRISRSIAAIGLGSLAFATSAFAHADTQAGPGFRTTAVTQVGPNADQRGPGISVAGSTTQVGPNADQRGPGIDPAAVSTGLPASASTSGDSGISVLALLLSLAGMGVVAAGGVALISARGRSHGAGTA